MRLFTTLYDQIIRWSKHRHAPYYLGALSFAESSVFPIPPDVMLTPMTLAQPEKALKYATITTLTSVLGGILGYAIGMFGIKLIYPLLVQFGYDETYHKVEQWFLIWDFWIIILAGFTPIPYKIFTIAAGAVSMPLLPFIAASLVGRASRFFLVAILVQKSGRKVEKLLYDFIDWIGWLLIISVCIIYVAIKL
jgi:membrane protein YqaA with SNARE-associated domain